MITSQELARIRSAAIGDMLGDSKVLDEINPAATIFRLCRELERLEIAEKAALACPKPLVWTSEPPKEGGWYWYRNTGLDAPKMVHIVSCPFGIAPGSQSYAGPILEPRESK